MTDPAVQAVQVISLNLDMFGCHLQMCSSRQVHHNILAPLSVIASCKHHAELAIHAYAPELQMDLLLLA